MSLRQFKPILIVLVGSLLVWQMALIEALIVARFWLDPMPEFRDFMSQSIYEGEAFGGSDIGVSLAIISFLSWLWLVRSGKHSSFLAPQQLKFIWISGLSTALIAVHSLKWVVSRARPKIILRPDLDLETLASMTWPGFMPWNGPRGLSWNSFPSGHTASCAIMLAFVYVAWPRSRIVGTFVFLAVAAYCGLMATARSMAGMHWLSDSIASFFLAWMVIHVLADRMNIISNSAKNNP